MGKIVSERDAFMPGKTLSQRFVNLSERSFWNFEHNYMEYLHHRIGGDIGSSADVLVKLMRKQPETTRRDKAWFERLSQVASELNEQTHKMTNKLREFSANNFRHRAERWLPYDAAAWDRYFALCVQTLAPFLPRLGELIEQLESLADEVSRDDVSISNRTLGEILKADSESNKRAFGILQQLLTEDGLEAYHAELVAGSMMGHLLMCISDVRFGVHYLPEVVSKASKVNQQNTGWFERLSHEASELTAYIHNLTSEVRQFEEEHSSELDYASSVKGMYDVAAWDRFWVSLTEKFMPYLSKLEQHIQRVEVLVDELPMGESDIPDEEFWKAVKGARELPRIRLGLLREILTHDSLASFIAEESMAIEQ